MADTFVAKYNSAGTVLGATRRSGDDKGNPFALMIPALLHHRYFSIVDFRF
jgi:hypothetical protein